MARLLSWCLIALTASCTCDGVATVEDGGTGAGSAGGSSAEGGGSSGGAAGGGAGGGSSGGAVGGGSGAGGSAGGATAGGVAGGSVSCDAGRHVCGATCVSDDAVETCGDRCAPCPTAANASATCTGRVCGLTCNGGFVACLGQCVPQGGPPCGLSLPANTFVLLLDGGTGSRTQAAMAYSADAGQYLLIGGARTMAPQPYDVLALDLQQRRWFNQHPPGRSWGPDEGNSLAPGFASERFETMDLSGATRPNFYAYGGMTSAYQYAWDETNQRLHFYLWNRTFSYDALARSWTFRTPSTDPGGGPTEPRLMWGALGYDATDDKLLLVGGGNVHTDAGEAGSWMFDVGQNRWRALSGPQPLRRAYSKLSVDPDRRKGLLFGGDELDRLKADTWVFDFATETWTEVRPSRSPPPRAGHQLLFLPQSRATVLLGGWGYTSTTDYVAGHYRLRPFELWKFDWSTNDWSVIKRFGPAEPAPSTDNLAWPAAAGAGDVVVLHFKNGYPDEFHRAQTWAIRIDPSVSDPAATAALSVDAGAITTRTGRYEPAWFNGPPNVDAGIATITANVWTQVTTPNRPATNHDWGTMAIDVGRRQLLRWSGGHSAYCGTDVLHYDLTTNRFSIGFPAELPLEFTYSNDQVPGYWSFKRRPWMTGHTYKTYAFDAVLDRMILYPRPYTHFYDVAAKEFTDPPVLQDLGGDYYRNTLEPIPTGMAAWTVNGLFLREGTSRTWTRQTMMPAGAQLPQQSPDQQSMVYDPTGNRLLLFPNLGADKGQVYEVTLGATKTLRRLDPGGRVDMAAMGPGFFRESELVTSRAVVVVASSMMVGGVRRMPVYDVAGNRWEAWRVSPATVPFGNSFAIAYDPTSDRIWALGQHNEPWVLQVNPSTADKVTLN